MISVIFLNKVFSKSHRKSNIVSISIEHLEYLKSLKGNDIFSKYHVLLSSILSQKIIDQNDILFVADPITHEHIYKVHSKSYIHNIEECLLFGEYSFEDMSLNARSYEIIRIFCNATIKASKIALKNKYSMLLGGGFHHALRDKAGGYCVLNDIAIAVQYLIGTGKAGSILVLDLDVHQGDGTASILKDIDNVFTISIHQEDNFPREKQVSSLDISINSSDFKPKVYFYNLKNIFHSILKNKKFDLIFYIAGVDTLKGDRLGSFQLNLNDLKKRDNIVFKYANDKGVPIVVLMGGGYNRDLNIEVEAYKNTIKLLRKTFNP